MTSNHNLETAFLPPHLLDSLTHVHGLPEPFFFQLPLSRTDIEAGLRKLRSDLSPRVEAGDNLYQSLCRENTEAVARAALFEHKEHEPERLLEEYHLYDRHFNVRRLGSTARENLECQIARTCYRLVSDLPHAVLARDTLEALLSGVVSALHFLPEQSESSETPEWDLPAEELRTVRYRWQTGHHLFGMWCHLAAVSFRRAERSLDDAEACALEIDRSGLFLKASSAAMEYAVNFPQHYYRDVLRPEMKDAPMPGGFSGSQNSDYNHMKIQKGILHARIILKHTRFPDRWPEAIRGAVERYRETNLEDLGVHVRVAAGMVAGGLSLRQQARRQSEISAVDALRKMAGQRAHDFGL